MAFPDQYREKKECAIPVESLPSILKTSPLQEAVQK